MSETPLNRALERIAIQQRSLDLVANNLGEQFDAAIAILCQTQKIITTGLGKSGFIARKMAATLASLTIPAYFLHPVDALHGDSGILLPTDSVVAFSKSGETPEVLSFVDHARSFGVSVVSVSSRLGSSLAHRSEASLYAALEREFDADDILPTASTTSALVLADVLALAIAEVNGTTAGLRSSHPHGIIGAGLMRKVEEVMHADRNLPVVPIGSTLSAALVELTAKSLGAVCVVNKAGTLQGILTDGDVRRLVQNGSDLAGMVVDDAMTVNPISVTPGTTLHEALLVMERRQKQISLVPVVSGNRCVGIVRVHDIVRINI